MKNWVNSWIIFRDEVIKAIVDLAIWFTLHRMQSLIKFTCVGKNHMGCRESNSARPHFILLNTKAHPHGVDLSCLLSVFFLPLLLHFYFPSPLSLAPSLSSSLPLSLSLPLLLPLSLSFSLSLSVSLCLCLPFSFSFPLLWCPSPHHCHHSFLVTYLFESYLYVRFLCFMSRMLTSRRGKCRMTVKQISQNVPSIVICF